MFLTTNGLVLRETVYKESSRILTVLTEAEGKITVSARGAKRRGSRTAASTQLLAYSEMTLVGAKGRWILDQAETKELFTGIREDISLLALGSYFAELLEALSDEDCPNPEVLSLGLNSLYALSVNLRPPELIKAAFELRLMCLSGYAPLLGACANCGKSEPQKAVFDINHGVLLCNECAAGVAGTRLNSEAAAAMRHVVTAEAKKVFSFALDGTESAKSFYEACEAYCAAQTERGFRTLDFWKQLRKY